MIQLGRPLLYSLAALPLLIVVGLLVIIIWISLLGDVSKGLTFAVSWRQFQSILSDPLIWTALKNTIGFSLVSVLVSMFFGISAAWLVERTDLPGKRTVYFLMTIGLLIPTFFMAMGWVFFLHPRIGMLNKWLIAWFDLDDSPFSISNVVGMGWVEGLGLGSLAFVMTTPIFRALNPALEEASLVHGLGRWRTLWHVVLPLSWPTLLATAIYISVIAIATFEVPAIIGLGSKIFTFATLVYIKVSPDGGSPNYGVVAAMSIFLLIASAFLSLWYFRIISLSHKYGVIQGKGYKPRLMRLGRKWWLGWLLLGIYFLLSKILPLLMMIWAALLPFFRPFSIQALSFVSLKNFDDINWGLVTRGLTNTFILMLAAPTLAIFFGILISWIVIRTKSKWRLVLDWVAFLPHAVPHLIFALAAVVMGLFIVPDWLPFYGTIYILLMVYVLARLSLVTRVLNGALLQIHRELEEAAFVSGLSQFASLRLIILPLLIPALLNLWIWNALLTYRELTMAAFMVTSDNITLPVVVWGLWLTGKGGQAAAVSLLFIASLAPLILAYWSLQSRGGVKGPIVNS
ncbi:MAG: iron ABC transporter permease [Alphaproteobacteria bacterium]|nr:iron ABC transporter permease [Alphaproteobacteria bacterium]